MSSHPDDWPDALMCWVCEDTITPGEKFDKGEDPETFDDIYSHARCTPIPVETVEDNERWWPR